jgi:hypothetical protein
MTTIRIILLSVLTLSMGCKSIETATFTARGCCPTCERLILDVVDIESVKSASWSQFDEQLTLKFFLKLTSEIDLQKKVALAGYDTDLFMAPDSVYQAMPMFCQYRD